MLLIETILATLAVLLAIMRPTLGAQWFERIEAVLSRVAKRRGLAIITVGATALALRAALLPIEPIPRPALNDEFSYLLMADTFAHGRLTNPTHPMWQHFETFHVNQKPTYGSMYYPAQGLILALGQKLLGHPYWGVWLSSGLMCGAFCWALQGWVPASWAFLGGVLAIIRLSTFSYWANSYWGGAVAALGGAIVLGAFPRIRQWHRIRDAVVLAVGLAILGNSRPYESLFFTAPILIALTPSLFKPKTSRKMVRRVLLPISGILLVTISAMGYYFWRCTGSPMQTPYMINVHTYRVAPLFPWQRLGPMPTYRNTTLKDFYTGWNVQQYNLARYAPAAHFVASAVKGELFFLGTALLAPFIVMILVLPYGVSVSQFGYKTSLLVLTCAVTFVGLSLPVAFEPHYAAPVCCAFYALEIQALRRIRIWRRDQDQHGLAVVRNLTCICVILFGIRAFAGPLHIHLHEIAPSWSGPRIENLARARIADSVSREPCANLIFVHYAANHIPQAEWVYNNADLDSSQIVWARDLGAAQNGELVRYFSNRKVWLLEAGLNSPRLLPYSEDATGRDCRATLKSTVVGEGQ